MKTESGISDSILRITTIDGIAGEARSSANIFTIRTKAHQSRQQKQVPHHTVCSLQHLHVLLEWMFRHPAKTNLHRCTHWWLSSYEFPFCHHGVALPSSPPPAPAGRVSVRPRDVCAR